MTAADREPTATTHQPPMSLHGVDAPSLHRQIVDIDADSLNKIVAGIADAQKTTRRERTRTGLAAARGRGQKLGRPCAMTEERIAFARRMLAEGATRKTIARTLKVSRSALYLALKPYAAEAP